MNNYAREDVTACDAVIASKIPENRREREREGELERELPHDPGDDSYFVHDAGTMDNATMQAGQRGLMKDNRSSLSAE